MRCPKCEKEEINKNGFIHNGKQKYSCKNCKRQFVENPKNKKISQEKIELIDRLLLEKIPLAGISRAVQVSISWIQKYVNEKFANIKQKFEVDETIKNKAITIQCDEMWSFVGKKADKEWIWIALEKQSRKIIGLHIGDRSITGAIALYESIPKIYRDTAFFYTDYWKAYESALPKDRHKSVGKDSGLTNYIERFNNTLRQRSSRLVRSTLSFSKKLENHIGSIWYFIHHYNLSLS